jgi:signal recognition particle receptor subunit beta
MKHSHIVIFVIDSSDRQSIAQAKEDLHRSVLKHKDLHPKACLLVLANKQDIEGCMTVIEIIDALQLNSITKRKWHVQGVSVMGALGLNQGVQWMER